MRILILVVVGVWGLFGPGLLGAESIKVGLFELKPHLFLVDGTKPAGAAVDYLTAVAAKTGTTLVWDPLPLSRLFAMLDSGELDCALMITKNPDRETRLVYADQGYLPVRPVLVVRKDNPVQSLLSGQEMQGWNIGALQGANLTPFMLAHASGYTLDLVAPEDFSRINVEKLLAGRIDAIFDLNDITYLYVARQLGVRDQIRLLPTPDKPGAVYVVASKKSPKGLAFLSLYNQGLKKGGLKYEDFLAPYLN